MTKEQFKAKYESIFADYPDIVNVAQLKKMLGINRHLATARSQKGLAAFSLYCVEFFILAEYNIK